MYSAAMTLLITYVFIALFFSFLCSIAEAVVLSVSNAYIAVQEDEGKKTGAILKELKSDINRPLAAILTLNTIAHTLGAAGAGAQAVAVFGSAYVGIASVVLTLLILVFSEIIPKTLGAHYWPQLAPATAFVLRFLVWLLYPFVKLSEWITSGMIQEGTLTGFSRREFAAAAELGAQEGQLNAQESEILQHLLELRNKRVDDVLTPRTVLFSLANSLTVEEYFHKHDKVHFTRIPIYHEDPDKVTGFVIRSDLFLAQARGNGQNTLDNYRREIPAILNNMPVSQAFDQLLLSRAHIMLVVDEYGGVKGIVTLEDILEELLGMDIVDESDRTVDMQKLARSRWKRRAREMGWDKGGKQD